MLVCQLLNTIIILRPRQNGRHFTDDIFKCIFLNENVWIPIEISLMFVPKGSINNNPALFQIMAWRHPGDKPLSEPMMVSLLTHICVTRPQWVKGSHMDSSLTYWGSTEKADIWRTTFTKVFFFSMKSLNFYSISLNLVLKAPIDNKSTMVKIMAWCQKGNKPFVQPIIVYWRIYASLGLTELTTAHLVKISFTIQNITMKKLSLMIQSTINWQPSLWLTRGTHNMVMCSWS